MADAVIEGYELVLRLSWLERVGALHGDVRVPLTAVRRVRVAPHPWQELRGIRAPGTGFPGLICLGTQRGGFGKDFTAVYLDRPAVVIDLDQVEFERLIVSVHNPQATAARVPVQSGQPAGGQG